MSATSTERWISRSRYRRAWACWAVPWLCLDYRLSPPAWQPWSADFQSTRRTWDPSEGSQNTCKIFNSGRLSFIRFNSVQIGSYLIKFGQFGYRSLGSWFGWIRPSFSIFNSKSTPSVGFSQHLHNARFYSVRSDSGLIRFNSVRLRLNSVRFRF